jgi:hypothetical protein
VTESSVIVRAIGLLLAAAEISDSRAGVFSIVGSV